MRHCRQCRADAIGLLGEDRGQEFKLDLLPDAIDFDSTQRDAYRDHMAEQRGAHQNAKGNIPALLASAIARKPALVAVATKGEGRINQHFGHAREFQIYEVDQAGVRFVGHRKLDDNYCQGGFGEEIVLTSVVTALAGVDAVFCAKIGHCPKDELAAAGIRPVDAYAYEFIETAIAHFYARSQEDIKATA